MPLTVLPTSQAISDALKCDLSTLQPFRPFIVGPMAGLHRYASASEKSGISLGAYNPNLDTAYSWPGRVGTSIIDQSYGKLWFENAYLRYFSDLVGAGSTVAPVATYTNRIASSAINFKSFTNSSGTAYPRDSTLYDRDVAVGDIVHVRATITSVLYELWTTVSGFVSTAIAATIASATADAANAGTQSLSSTIVQSSGTVNVVSATLTSTAYKSTADGYINRTYTVRVTTGSTGLDATTARLSVTSSDGGDNVASVTPAAFSSATNIGTKGLTATFTNGGTDDFVINQVWTITVSQAYTAPTATSNTAGTYTGLTDTKYIATVTRGGQVPTVDAPATAATAASASSGGSLAAGTYYAKYTFVNANGETTSPVASSSFTTASSNLTIVLTLTDVTGLSNGATSINVYLATTLGGVYHKYKTGIVSSPTSLTTAFDPTTAVLPTSNTCTVNARSGVEPLVVITTTTGVDASGPTIIQAKNQAFTVGTQGVTLSLNQNTVNKGDIFYVVATAAKLGAIKTLILANDLPTALQTASDMDLELFIKKPLVEVAKINSGSLAVNWSSTDTYVTVKSNIQIYDPSWTNSGVQLLLPVTQATAYAEFREWLVDLAGSILSFSSPTDALNQLGTLDPDNPICFGVHKAFENTASLALPNSGLQSATALNTVRCAVLGGEPTNLDTTYQAWVDAIGLATGSDQVYNLVPLTSDTNVHALTVTEVETQSDPTIGLRRACLLPVTVATSSPLVSSTTTSDGATALGTIAQDPGTTSTAFTYLRVPAGNAKFITNGVVAHDTVRFLFSVDSTGASTWTEFTIKSVVSEDALLLESGTNAAVSTPQKVEVWRYLSKGQTVAKSVSEAAAYANSRVQMVWPDTASVSGVTVPGYFVCAALAGLYGSVPSHQSLTNVQLLGFDAVPRSSSFLSPGQKDALIAGGVLVVDAASDGTVYVRRDVTTDTSLLTSFESMSRRNMDMVAWALLSSWAVYLGYCNNTTQTMNAISNAFFTSVAALKATNSINRLGPPIYSATLDVLRVHPTLADRVQVTVTMVGPTALNGIQLTINV